jgi:hypothetical protein
MFGRKMSGLTLFGLFATSSMVVCYSFENRSPWFVLGFAVSCLLGSAYGFLQGAWPFGLVEIVWSSIAVRKWWIAASGKRSAVADNLGSN